MGYYTRYQLRNIHLLSEEAIAALEDAADVLPYILSEYCDSTKWYEHEADMLAISKRFPKDLFHLYGDGEESGDMWHKYFKNGKMQICKAQITFEPFNEAKLK